MLSICLSCFYLSFPLTSSACLTLELLCTFSGYGLNQVNLFSHVVIFPSVASVLGVSGKRTLVCLTTTAWSSSPTATAPSTTTKSTLSDPLSSPSCVTLKPELENQNSRYNMPLDFVYEHPFSPLFFYSTCCGGNFWSNRSQDSERHEESWSFDGKHWRFIWSFGRRIHKTCHGPRVDHTVEMPQSILKTPPVAPGFN